MSTILFSSFFNNDFHHSLKVEDVIKTLINMNRCSTGIKFIASSHTLLL